MNILGFWSQLHPLGKALFVGGSLSLFAFRFHFFSLSETKEKYLRSFALGMQGALLFWPLFSSSLLRGRVDLSLWLLLPLLWVLGSLLHFTVHTFPKINIPLRDYSFAAIVGLFFVPWAPLESIPAESAAFLWAAGLIIFLLSCELRSWKNVGVLTLVTFFFALLGFFFSGLVPLFVIFLLGIWSFGILREMLVLFSFFPEGNKRFIPALIAFGLTMAAGLAWA